MTNNLISYLIALIVIIYGIRALISFNKDDKKESFQSTTAETWIVKKTIGRENYIRFHNLIWGILWLIGGIAIITMLLKE